MEETIQVKMSYLNKLLDQTGEVIITGTRLAILEKAADEIFAGQKPLDKTTFNLIKQISMTSRQTANHLHKNVMDIRQVEFKETMITLQRLVRDLSKTQGKPVKFMASGNETLVDKTIIEELSGALIHVIRNSVDHGIESSEARQANNKPAEGRVSINAYKKDRFIYVEVEDDGSGIDLEKVCAKALDRELTTPEKLEKMTREEKYEFILLPGFSTRETVSEVSGRGVGMDVVKTSVEKLNGVISISSKLHEGTRFTFKIPIISAVNITDALMIDVAGSIYAIPISTVVATLSVSEADLRSVSGQCTIMFRGSTLTVYDLTALLYRRMAGTSPKTVKNIVVVMERDDVIGICVDRFLPPQKIVIKMLDDCFSNIRGISGTTLLSGDTVGLIIDASEIINLAMGRENASKTAAVSSVNPEDTGLQAKKQSVKQKENSLKKYKIEIDSNIDPAVMLEIALNSQGKLLDAFNNNEPVYEIDLMLEKDIIKAEKSRFDIYQKIKTCGDILFVVPMTAQIADNIIDFSPENFDMSIKFFVISNILPKDIAGKLNIDEKQIRAVGITVKEDVGHAAGSEENIFYEVELLEDYETFALDTQKNLSMMTQSILNLEKNAEDAEAVKEIFRAVHTIKSSTAMLGIKNMSEIAHELETMLDKVRSGLEFIDEERVDLLFDVLKFFEECMKSIANGVKPVVSNAAVKERVLKFKEDTPEKKLVRVIDVKTEKFQITAYENLVISEKIAQEMKLYSILVEFVPDLPMKMVNAFMLFKSLKEYGDVVKTIPTMEEIDKGNFEMYFKILFVSSSEADKFKIALQTEEIKTFDISRYEGR